MEFGASYLAEETRHVRTAVVKNSILLERYIDKLQSDSGGCVSTPRYFTKELKWMVCKDVETKCLAIYNFVFLVKLPPTNKDTIVFMAG